MQLGLAEQKAEPPKPDTRTLDPDQGSLKNLRNIIRLILLNINIVHFNNSREKRGREGKELEESANKHLDAAIDLAILELGIEGEMSAFEGILIVKERVQE